jgi:tRNA (mo5U34)-methyltransferase
MDNGQEMGDVPREVAAIKWFHRIDLGHGIVTPGVDDSPKKLQQIGMPEDLSGLAVLDIGAFDGFFSFAAERRGASRVLAVDSYCWSGKGWSTKAGFELARKTLNSKVEDMEIEVLDIGPEKVGVFDLVLFLGVLYHMRHPFLALERVASVTGKQLILETHVDMLWRRRPAMAFYPGADMNRDPTNWWGPNPAAVVAMLQEVGFKRVQVLARYRSRIRRNRLVVHAWR